ncbi:unnamed protein product [Chrysodeixis includens]|uniref:Carboxylic ester hydrolase n=1 Tax=Chrysodeixis includens TaxID=689277 RepID=A0A9N8KXT9_CHRIL|nr:unnamed protein product [Chrysodeixis includens]
MVQVRVNEGILEGEKVGNDFGAPYFSFKGIPYAQPPIGDLRFKAPVPPKSWEGVRQAKEHGPCCYQNDIVFGQGVLGSEDCLYLNVYTPDIKPEKPLPVMVWIHGGGFIAGSGESDLYGPEFLVRQDVIVVTINYRLEVLGFLCLNTEEVPGNAGMKDQVQALRWVNKNITHFGGDPDNVTIFGESAGGGSVSYHLLSPMSKGLFKRAIPQSGACLSCWSYGYRPFERALALARSLGFYSEDPKELHEFFKNQPVESLVATAPTIALHEKAREARDIYFNIVDELKFGDNERFFYGNVYDRVYKGIHENIDIMTGFTTDEGLVFLGPGDSVPKKLEMATNYPESLVTRPLSNFLSADQLIDLGKEIKQYYLKDQPKSSEDWEYLVKIFSMDLFVYPTIRFVQISAAAEKNKIYLYNFSCKSERNVLAHIFGLTQVIGAKSVTSHADDIMYLFNAKAMKTNSDTKSASFKLIERVTKLWTNFAKYGNPTPDDSLGAKWEPYTVKNEAYLDIGNELSTGSSPYAEEVQFWKNIFEKYGHGN